MRSMIGLTVLTVLAWLAPEIALAQTGNSGIAGVVRDTNGGVLPGATVEAASPALIEKVRTVVTGDDGTYRILDLRPGVYAVTFSLQGFRTVRREGLELPAAFTATVSADLEVGAVAETITVTGQAPLVDVQNVTSQRVMGRDLLDSIPVTSRSPQGFASLMPGVIGQGIAGTPGGREEMNVASHGAQARDSLFLIDGASVGGVRGEGGAAAFFRISQAYVGEITVTLGGGTAELAYSGTVTNVIPKEGGNRLTGSVYLDYAGKSFSASNLTPELEAQGFTKDSLSNLRKLWDVSPSIGGPIARDKLWFFASFRHAGSVQTRAGLFENATPLGWGYTPDRTRPAVIRLVDKSQNMRLTWQATQNNKFGAFVDNQPHIVFQRGYQNQISPEATAYAPFPNFFYALNWKSTIEQSFIAGFEPYLQLHRYPAVPPHSEDLRLRCARGRLRRDFGPRQLDGDDVPREFRPAERGAVRKQQQPGAPLHLEPVVRHRRSCCEVRVQTDARTRMVRMGHQRRARLYAPTGERRRRSRSGRRRSGGRTTSMRILVCSCRISGP